MPAPHSHRVCTVTLKLQARVRYVFRAEFNVKTGEPPRAGWTELAGQIWPVGPDFADPCFTVFDYDNCVKQFKMWDCGPGGRCALWMLFLLVAFAIENFIVINNSCH